MKRSLVYVLLLALVLTGMGIYGAAKVDAGSYVKYYLPYLHTNTNNVVYCIVSNGGGMFDNVSKTKMTVTSNGVGTAAQTVINPDDTNAQTLLAYRSSAQITFSGQYVYIGTANSSIFDLTSYTSTASGSGQYGAVLTFVGDKSGVTGTNNTRVADNLDCKKIGMACFQGTTSPKRNLVGYTCEAGTYDGITYRVYKSISITSGAAPSSTYGGMTVGAAAAATAGYIVGNGMTWAPANMSGDGTGTTSGTDNSTDLAY